MALPLNKIGPHTFITLNREAAAPLAKVDLFSRAGVHGYQAVHLGERGEPFTLVSTVDVPGMTDGEDLYLAYGALIGTTTEQFTLHDVDIAARDNAALLVLDVKKIMLHKCLKIVGGINSSPTCLLVCEWQLVLLSKPS